MNQNNYEWIVQTELMKKSTATEHASSASPPDPAASVTGDSRLPLTGLPRLESSENGYLLAHSDLEKIVALLLWMAQDFQSIIHIDDIHHAALETIIKHSDGSTGGAMGLLHAASVTKLSELIDIMMVDRNGSPKDANATLTFMRRLAKIREELRTTSSDNATERVELDKDEVSLCYRRFGRILLTHDLLPQQKRDKRYHLRKNGEGDTSLSGFQRSFTDNLLRKFLGDRKVAFLIWQHGIPSIADRPLVYNRRLDSKLLDMGMLQSGLDECLQWYSCLANHIVATRPKKVSTPSCRRAPWTNRSSNGSRRAGKRYRKRGMPCGSVQPLQSKGMNAKDPTTT